MKSCRQKNLSEEEKRGKHTTRRERARHEDERERERRRGKVSGAGPAFFPLISSTPLITVTEGGQEREKVSEEMVKLQQMDGARKGKREGWQKKKREKKREKKMEGDQQDRAAQMQLLANWLKKSRRLKIEAELMIWSLNDTPNKAQKMENN